MNNYVIAADIGNTNAHIGLINYSSRSILSLDIFPSAEVEDRFIDSIVSLSQSMKHAAPMPIVVSSVMKSLEGRHGDALLRSVNGPVSWVRYSPSLPITVHYDDPAQLGADRLVNCFYGADVARGRSVIIISAGTTITVDYLKAGREFSGGAILPGLSMQLQSLHDHTELLPLVDASEIGIELPGLSTKSCILDGVRWGIAGSLSFLVDKYKQHFNEEAMVLTTGGAWKYVQDHVNFAFEYVPELTLVGCALYQRSLPS
jgi:type III pantothenate kinase